MPSYAMTGNGIFGGSNNFLSILGGIGNQNNDPMTDPMYAQQYNIMSILGGR